MKQKTTQGIYGINANKNSLHTRKRKSSKRPLKRTTAFKPGADLSKQIG